MHFYVRFNTLTICLALVASFNSCRNQNRLSSQGLSICFPKEDLSIHNVHRRIPTGSFPQNFMKIRLDLAEILRISKLDWRDGGGKEGRKGGIVLCNGLII